MTLSLLLASLVSCALSPTSTPLDPSQAEDLAWMEIESFGAMEQISPDLGLAVTRQVVDSRGMGHVRYQQELDGVPVFEGEAIVHLLPDGRLSSITDNLVRSVQVDTRPTVSLDDALETAVQASGGWEGITDDPEVDLLILRRGGDRLAWRVQVERMEDPSRPLVFVDAHTGEVVWQFENLKTDGAATGTGTAYYSGSVSVGTYLSGTSYYLEDTSRKLGTYSYNSGRTSLSYVTDTDNVWSSSTTAVALEAHYASTKVYDYYLALGRTGIDGAGGPGVISSLTGSGKVITSGVSYSRKYNNAYWSGTMMVYGDGDGTTFKPLTTVDIAGHEMTHGVTDYTSKLTYSGESGGLNESLSDIFGAAVEAWATGGVSANTWLIGEQSYTPSISGDALRYMNDPARDGSSPDFYSSSVGSMDVHYSSGIGNLAFYLMSAGGSHPRGKSTTVVSGIGIDAAAAIWYRANAVYFTAGTNYAAARTATLSAATDLYGASSAEVQAVGDAWTAVGVDGGGSSGSTCSGTSYTGSLSYTGASAYAPSSSGFSASSGTALGAELVGPSGANFDLYLEKKDKGTKYLTVASSTSSGATETISYTTTSSGTYRWRVSSVSGSGSLSLCTTP